MRCRIMTMGMWGCFGCLVMACLLANADELRDGESMAVSLEGKTFPATLIGIRESGLVRFRSDGSEESCHLSQWVRWGSPVWPSRGRDQEVYWGSSLLCAELLRYTSETLEISHRLWGRITLSSPSLRGVILRSPRLPDDADSLRQRVLTADEGGDWLLLANGDTVRCTVSLIDREEIRVIVDQQPLTIARHRVVAVGFDPATRRGVENHAKATVGWADGSLMAVTSLALDNLRCEATLVGGVRLTTSDFEEAGRQLCFLRPHDDRVVYLSDLPPRDYRHIPWLSIAWPLEKDRNVLGRVLLVRGQWYDKGLGMHSASRVVFELVGKFRTFAAAVAVDDAAGEGGSVTFRVYTEDVEGTWQLAWESPLMRGRMRRIEMSVDVRETGRIALVVDRADGVDQRDYADWLEPRLIRD